MKTVEHHHVDSAEDNGRVAVQETGESHAEVVLCKGIRGESRRTGL